MKNLLRYIRGFRNGKDAYDIELKAIKDPFLSDALDGYDAVESNHQEKILYLTKQVRNCKYKKSGAVITLTTPKQKTVKPKRYIPWKKWSIVVSLFLCVSLGIYFIVRNSVFITHAPPMNKPEPHHETEKIQPDTLIIYMPKPPVPKKKRINSPQVLEDNLREEPTIEIIKLESPSIPITSSTVDLPVEIEVSF